MQIWMSLAIAASPSAEDQAWHAFQRSCYTEAIEASAPGLRADPTNAGLHRVHAAALAESNQWKRRGRASDAYERHLKADPSHLGLRIGLANLLVRSEPNPPCDRVDELLAAEPDAPDHQYNLIRARQTLSGWCASLDRAAADADLAALAEAGHTRAAAQVLAQTFDAASDPEEIRKAIEAWPVLGATVAWRAWREDSTGLKRQQKAVLELAQAWRTSKDLGQKMTSARMLAYAGKPDSKLEREIDEASPCARPAPWKPSKLWQAIQDAQKHPTHELALESLDRLAKKMPEFGVERAEWQKQRLKRLSALGRTDEAYSALRDRANALPKNIYVGSDWAFQAAARGEDLEQALARMAPALEDLDTLAWDPSSDPYDTWAEEAREVRSRRYDAHAWLLHLLDRDVDAAHSANLALAASSTGIAQAHAGLIHLALDDPQRAFAHLRQAFVDGIEEEALEAECLPHLEVLYGNSLSWHPGGFDAWVEELPALAAPETSTEADRVASSHILVGKPFPIPTATALDGDGDVALAPDGRIMVVDLWATWCGPCVQGMPHLQAVSEKYPDKVRVVGLSVDAKATTAERFFKGASAEYELAWVGKPGWNTLSLSGIPALFIVNTDGDVVDMIVGYGEGDTRLEEVLDTLLQDR